MGVNCPDCKYYNADCSVDEAEHKLDCNSFVPSSPGVYTLEEVAVILKVSTKTLKKLIEKGEMKAFRVGNRWRVNKIDLGTFMEKHPL